MNLCQGTAESGEDFALDFGAGQVSDLGRLRGTSSKAATLSTIKPNAILIGATRPDGRQQHTVRKNSTK